MLTLDAAIPLSSCIVLNVLRTGRNIKRAQMVA